MIEIPKDKMHLIAYLLDGKSILNSTSLEFILMEILVKNGFGKFGIENFEKI